MNIHSALVFVLFLKQKSNCRELDPLGLLLHEKMEKHRQRYHCQTSKQISVNKTHMLKPLKRRGTYSNSSRHTTGKWFKILEMLQVIFKLNNLFVPGQPTQKYKSEPSLPLQQILHQRLVEVYTRVDRNIITTTA